MTTDYIPKVGASGLIGNSIIYDNGTNLGLGTTAPTQKIHIAQSFAGNIGITIQNTNASYSSQLRFLNAAGVEKGAVTYVQSDGGLYFNVNAIDALMLKSNGNIGMGTSNPAAAAGLAFVLNSGASQGRICIKTSGTGDASGDGLQIGMAGTSAFIEQRENAELTFATNASERMRINSNGNIGINGTAGSNAKLQVFGDVAVGSQQSGGDIAFYVSSAADGKIPALFQNTTGGSASQNLVLFQRTGNTVGSITSTNSNTSYNTSSDYRLKEDLRDFKGLEKISNIKVYDFKWKISNERNEGVLAHELAEIIPFAVVGNKDGKYMQGVDYSKIVPSLVKAIQELKSELDQLKAK